MWKHPSLDRDDIPESKNEINEDRRGQTLRISENIFSEWYKLQCVLF